HQADRPGAGALHLQTDRRGPRRRRPSEESTRRGGRVLRRTALSLRDRRTRPGALTRNASRASSEKGVSMPTLLVVDDEPNVLYSLEKALEGGDLEVLTAPTGKQGVELVQRRPDAVLLDVRLTDMTGLEAFDRIRTIDPRVPIILITA